MPPVNYVTFEMTAVALCNLILPNHERAWLAKPCDCIVIPKFVFFVFEEVNSKGTDHIFAHKPLIWLIQTHLNFKTWNVWKNRLIELVDSSITYEYLYLSVVSFLFDILVRSKCFIAFSATINNCFEAAGVAFNNSQSGCGRLFSSFNESLAISWSIAFKNNK